jgi:hypothetical protein
MYRLELTCLHCGGSWIATNNSVETWSEPLGNTRRTFVRMNVVERRDFLPDQCPQCPHLKLVR